MILFDVESSPLPDAQLERVKPKFEPPSNYKKADVIEANLAEQEAAWIKKAALSPLTGQILALGMMDTFYGGTIDCFVDGEKSILEAFWDKWSGGGRFVGFSIKSFDLPFIVGRSRILNMPVPEDLWEGRYWNRRIICLQELWCCYSNRTEGASLDAICTACGIGSKLEGMTGADFAKVFAEDQNKALAYLRRDIQLTAQLAVRLGIT